jgi:4-aminobutyrate aminotransferase-like enzyme
MKMMHEEDFATSVPKKGAYFLHGLQELQRRHKIIGDVDGLGLALRAEICAEDGVTPDKAMVDRMVDEALKGDIEHDGRRYGLVLDIGGYHKNVITLAPSLTISYAEIDLAIALLDKLFARVSRP